MDDKLIIDFINNIEPNMSYGSSDDISRAMVESAENMALINDYIVESTYEVYTEAEDKQGFIAKIKNKVHSYFILFVNLVKKAIEKFKGFFFTLKRKLTVAMAKALKAIDEMMVLIASDKTKLKVDKDALNSTKLIKTNNTAFNIYEIDDKMYTKLVNHVRIPNDMTKFMVVNNNSSLEEIEGYIDGIRETFDDEFVKPAADSDTGSVLLKLKTYKLSLGAEKVVRKEIGKAFKDVDHVMEDFYDCILGSYGDVLNMLKKQEKDAKKAFIDNPKELSTALKRISKFIHTFNNIKYKSGQLVASACLKMYKKSFSEAKRLLKNTPKAEDIRFTEPRKEEDVHEAYNIGYNEAVNDIINSL
jgi:hypothetical protein